MTRARDLADSADKDIAGTITLDAVNASGVITGLTVEATGTTAAGDNAAMGYTTAEGLILTGQGSTNDVTIKNDANADVAGTLTQTGVATFTAKPIANAGLSAKNGATSAGFIEFFEDSNNGSNKVTLIGPAATADVTLTLPAAAGIVATTDDATALAIALG